MWMAIIVSLGAAVWWGVGMIRKYLVSGVLIIVLIGSSATILAADKQVLPIPRFVSLKFNMVNMRVGPGTKYPVSWVFTRKELPVEIIAEFDVWRKIRDMDGTEGWVNQTSLAGKRSVIIRGEIRPIRSRPDPLSSPLAQAEPGVIGKLLECPTSSPDWCRVDFGEIRGWARRVELYGIYPQETFPAP